MPKLQIELVDDWRNFTKWWSWRFNALGALITGLLVAWPDCLLQIFQQLPPDVRVLLGPHLVQYIAFGLFVMATLSRLVKQRKLEAVK